MKLNGEKIASAVVGFVALGIVGSVVVGTTQNGMEVDAMKQDLSEASHKVAVEMGDLPVDGSECSVSHESGDLTVVLKDGRKLYARRDAVDGGQIVQLSDVDDKITAEIGSHQSFVIRDGVESSEGVELSPTSLIEGTSKDLAPGVTSATDLAAETMLQAIKDC